MLFYIIFGTNLLTQSPVPVFIFPCFLVLQKMNTKRSPNKIKLYDDFSWNRRHPRNLERGLEDGRGGHKPPRRALGGALRACGPLGTPPTLILAL